MSKLKIYKASAGSGKTYTLALEYIRELLMKPQAASHRHILAVTFTKDATGEMKDRILAELYGLAFNTNDSAKFLKSLQEKLYENDKPMNEDEIRTKAGQILQAILHDYSRLNITTIDSFFQRVLRNLARELGTGSRFNLEMNTAKVRTEAVRATIDKARPNTPLLEWLTTYIETKIDDGKSWNIEDEIIKFSACLYNEYFQENEAELHQQLEENPKIIGELGKKQREIQRKNTEIFQQSSLSVNQILDTHLLQLSDFGNSKYAILFLNKLAAGDYSAKTGAYVLKAQANPEFWGAAKSKRKTEIQALAQEQFIPLLNRTLEAQADYNTSRIISRNLHQLGLIGEIIHEIRTKNKEKNRFMLSDTAQFLNRMMDGADAPFIYEKIGAEIKHVMIDEFQDTSRLQWSNFKVLLSDIISNHAFSLIVGDVKQSIYRWRNGDWSILNNIGAELGAQTETLGYNFRSETEVIDFNNLLFPQAAEALDSLAQEQFGESDRITFSSIYKPEDVAQKYPGKDAKGFVSIDFIPKKDEEDSKFDEITRKNVVEKLVLLQKNGVKAKDICILARKNSHIAALADHLASLHEEFPALSEGNYLNLVSSEAFQLNSSLAVKIIIETLRLIASLDNPVCRVQLEFYLASAGFDDIQTRIDQIIGKDLPTLSRMPLFELIAHLYQTLGLEKIEGQSPYLFTFFDAITNFQKDQPADIPNFLSFWAEELHKKTISTGEGIEGVRAMTIHKSKGLQFHTVIVPYCNWKINPEIPPTLWSGPKPNFHDLALLPVNYSKSLSDTIFAPEYREETLQSWMDNLNLLYVAFTRAEKNLIILGQENEKEGVIKNVSDLVRSIVPNLQGNYNAEKRIFTQGVISPSETNKNTSSEAVNSSNANPLRTLPPVRTIRFHSFAFENKETIFRQSNQSYEFLHPDKPTKQQYVAEGNLMHKLFELITSKQDIDRVAGNFLTEGLVDQEERDRIAAKAHQLFNNPEVAQWFSDKYQSYQECTILFEENGEIKQKRPDKVLLAKDTTLVVDFKFGAPHTSHRRQVKQYMDLLRQMNYPGVKGLLWYANENRIEEI